MSSNVTYTNNIINKITPILFNITSTFGFNFLPLIFSAVLSTTLPPSNTGIGIKLIIDILNYQNIDYIPRLLDHLKQYTIVCNTNNKELGGDMVEIFSYPLQVSTSLIVDFSSISCKKNKKCKYEFNLNEEKVEDV